MTTTAEESLQTEWQTWHAARERALAEPHGWLTLTGLHWLTEQPQRFHGVPGEWRVSGDAAVVTASAEEGLTVNGAVLDGTAEVTVGEGGTALFARYGDDIAIEVAVRTGRYLLRPRDPNAPTLVGFTGVPAFEVAGQWVLPAKFTAYPEPREVVVFGAQPGLRHRLRAAGELTFTAGGEPQSLVVTQAADGTLSALFHDRTNGDTTAPWRTVSTAAPDADGNVLLDLNRAVNLPYSFSPFGTCPQPPAGNVIGVPVEAGERTPLSYGPPREFETR